MKLNAQLNRITEEAISIVRDAVVKHKGDITLYEGEKVEDGELTDEFLNAVPEINHYTNDFEGNTIMYPYLIKCDMSGPIMENCYVYCLDETGGDYTIDLFELDAFNITILADHLTK